MSDEKKTERVDRDPARRSSRFLKTAIGLTIVVAAIIGLALNVKSEIVEWIDLSPDVLQACVYILIMVLMLVWMSWIMFFSGRNWLVRLIMLVLLLGLPVVFFSVLRPVNDGDLGISRFEPIWMAKRVMSSDVESSSFAVDLKTVTPNDFPEFLGKNRNGVVTGQAELSDNAVGDSSEFVWKHDVGEGWSGFSARNGYAVTMEQRGEFECVICYEIETGNLQWLNKHRSRHRDAMGMGRVGPRSTPTIHDGNVYSMGAMGNLICLDGADGKVIWQHDLLDILGIDVLTGTAGGFEYQYEDSQLAWGRAGSPLIVEDLVVVTGGGPRGGPMSTLLAFDKVTGELRWKAGADMIAYGSPSLATLAGKNQIALVGELNAFGFDAKTGEELWKHSWPGSSEGAANCSQVTVLSDNLILLTKAYGAGAELVEINEVNAKFTAESVESNPRVLRTKMMSPIIFEGYAYSLSDGFLECVDLSDLSRKWKRRGRFGHGQMLLCGDKLLVHSEYGTLYLVKANPAGYEELGHMATIKGVCWNTVCRYGEFLLVRSDLEAACIRLVQSAE